MQISQLIDLKKYEKLVLGFSGGADSTALALYLVSKKISFEAVHFHHHLRPESADNDALFCKEFCKRNKIPFTLVDIPVNELKESGESTESAARRLRMKFWQKNFASSESAILLAHHKDDVVENFFIRSMRGSSSSGLSGLREEKVISGVTYLRPLLSSTKAEILAFLKLNNTQWCEDESNKENVYTRNIFRNKIIPALSEIAPIEGIYRTAENITSDALYIEEQAEKWLSENELTKDTFLSLHDALKPRVIRLFIQRNSGRDFIPGHDAINRITDELLKTHFENSLIPLGDGIDLTLGTNGELFIEAPAYNFEWDWQKNEYINLPYGRLFISTKKTDCCESFKKSDLAKTLTIRNWQNGDRMIPFGRKKPAKVKDMFTNAKTSHSLRKQLPLLISGENIIWIPEVKRAEFARFNSADETLTITYERF